MRVVRANLRLIRALTMLSILVVSLCFILASPPQKVGALPCHEVEHHYFDSAWAVEVGVRYVTCSGVYTYGTVTPYVVSWDGEPCCGNCPNWC